MEKIIEHSVNPFNESIKTTTITWKGWNDNGEFIWHCKTIVADEKGMWYTAYDNGIEHKIVWAERR